MIDKPYYRCYRPVKEVKGDKYHNGNRDYSSWKYIADKEYSKGGLDNIKSFILIQKDLEEIFEYIEPSINNEYRERVYSHKIYSLFIRVCMEIETNFRQILKSNGYELNKSTNMKNTYFYVNKTHFLSDYKVFLYTRGNTEYIEIKPFSIWNSDTFQALPWYNSYNKCKHDRLNKFEEANLDNLLSATAGLLVLLSSQFNGVTFATGSHSLGLSNNFYNYVGEPALGNLFRIEYPILKEEDEYCFNWFILEKEENRFQSLDYNSIINK